MLLKNSVYHSKLLVNYVTANNLGFSTINLNPLLELDQFSKHFCKENCEVCQHSIKLSSFSGCIYDYPIIREIVSLYKNNKLFLIKQLFSRLLKTWENIEKRRNKGVQICGN